MRVKTTQEGRIVRVELDGPGSPLPFFVFVPSDEGRPCLAVLADGSALSSGVLYGAEGKLVAEHFGRPTR